MRRFCGVCLLLSALAALATGLSDTEEKTVAEIHSDVGVGQNILEPHRRDTREDDKKKKNSGNRPKGKRSKTKNVEKGAKQKRNQRKDKKVRDGDSKRTKKKVLKKGTKKEVGKKPKKKKKGVRKVKGKKVRSEKKKKNQAKSKKIVTKNQKGLKETKTKNKEQKVNKERENRKKTKITNRNKKQLLKNKKTKKLNNVSNNNIKKKNNGTKRKSKNKRKDKKNTPREKDRLRKKLKKIKALKKLKEEKSTGKKRKQLRQKEPVAGNCNNVTCLNNIMSVLKYDKDAVQNYMNQKKRMDAGISLGKNKGGKKSFMNETLNLLVSSFGGEAALKRKAPICAGRYNSTKANDGAKLLKNLTDCETKIGAACDVDHKSDTSAKLDACNAKFLDFRVKVNLTKENAPLNCSRWDNMMNDLIPDLKKCTKGNDTNAKTKGDEIKKKMIECKTIVASCKGWEDQSLSYIATCKTSSSNLKTILFALYKSKDKLNKVSTQISSALATTTKEGRQKRDLGDCTSLTTAVTKFTLYSSQVQIDTLGSNETIKKVAETITNTKTTTITCTSAEKDSITASQVSITVIVKQCEARITEVKTMLSDLTGTTIAQAEIDKIPTLPLAVAATTTKAATLIAETTKAATAKTTGTKGTTVKPETTVTGSAKVTTATVAGTTTKAGTSVTSGTTGAVVTTATLSQTTSTASLPDQPDAPLGLQAKNTRLVENSEATNGVTDSIDTLGTASSRSKRATWIIKSRTRGIRFIYIYWLIRGFKSALSRTVYSSAALSISKTILRTISMRNVLPPTKKQQSWLVSMKTSLVTMKTTIKQYTIIVQKEIVTTNNNGGKPIDTETSIANKLQMKYPFSGTVSDLPVLKNNKMHLIRLMQALMANRDGMLKITTLITKILTTTTISTSATTVATIIEKAQGVEALSVCLYGREMYHSVIQALASELVKQVGSSYTVQAVATSTEVTTMTETLSALNSQIVLITKVIMEIHSELLAETGGKFNIQTVSIMIISMETSNFGLIVEQAAVNPPPTTVVVLTASQQEAKLTTILTELKMVLTNIQIVRTILVKIQTNAMVSGSGTTTSIELLISQFIQIVLLITNEKVTSTEFSTLLTQLQAVTKVQTLTTSQTVIIFNLIEVVTMIEVTYTGSVSGASMGLIGNKGLLGKEVSATLSFEEQAKAAETQLNTQRSNCDGMDKAAKALDTLVETTTMKFVCADKFDEDCDSMAGDDKTSAANLVSLVLQVTKLSAANLEDVQILEISKQIVQLISSVTMLTMEQKNTIVSLTLTISSTVLVYVSQISIIESKKFEIGGAIVFPGASTAVIDKNDFAAKKTVLEVQLRNLFKISDSNDKVIECISKIESLPKAESPKKNKALQKKAKKVPAMCGAPEPPVEDVQETAAEIVKTCATATEQPVEGQLKSLLFIKTSLISFKMTFTSQITVFSQQLSDITGVTVTAATLKTTVILPSGATGVATAVDISGGLTIGSKEFYIVRYQIIKASIIAIGHVLTKITQIITLTGDDASGTTSPSNFALLIAQFNAKLSSGAVTENLIEIATKILTAKVTSAPSKAIIINLNSALSTLNKLQMTCLSDVVVIKQRLVLVLTQAGTSLSEVNFSVKTISETGVVTVVVEAGGASATATAAQLKETSSLIVKSSSALTSIQTLVSSVTILDFSSITTATNEISISIFMMKLSRFLVLIGTGNTNIEIHTLATELMTYRVTSISEAYIIQLNFILSTIVTYRVQVTVEIAIISSQISGGDPGGFSEEKNMATFQIFSDVKGYFNSFNSYMGTATASQNQGCTISAGDFLQSALKFFTLVTTSSGFSSIATQASTQVKAVQTSLDQVCPFSGKLVLQINGIVSGMTTCIMIISAQMDTIKIATAGTVVTEGPEPSDPPATTAMATTTAIAVPPCPHIGRYDCQGCMLEELEGLFSNHKSLETGIAALDTALACTNTENTITPADFIIILDTLDAVVQLYTPGHLHQGIVKQISTLLVTLSTQTGCANDSQKEVIQSYIGKLTEMRLMVLVQVTILQGDFILQCGSTVDPQTIIGDVTPSPTSVVLPFDVELEINGSIALLQQILTWTMQIIQILIQIIGGTFVDASGPTCDVFFGYVMEFITLLIQGDFGPNLEAAWTKVTSVTGISGQCSVQITLQIQIIISTLFDASLNIIATITQLFQSLIVSRGLIINIVSFEVQYVTQAEELASSLNNLRMNCGGVDRVSQQLVIFIEGLEPTPACTSDEQMEPLMKAIMELLVTSATDIADRSIDILAGNILTLISNVKVPCISIKFYARIMMCINILSDTVTTYVSQIALVEQRRLQITGYLSFSISITEVAAHFDFVLKTDIKKKQLEGLMNCGSFTDNSAASIETSKQVIEPKGSCSGRTIQKLARKVTAMCSSAELPLDDIEENTNELVECASTLDGPVSAGVLWSLEFILITLSSFRVTFSSQIVIIQQSLSILTGQKIIIEEIRPHTEWNLIEMIDSNQETEMILTAEWHDVCFAHSTMGIVMTAMTRVLDIQGSIETSEESFVSSSEFLHSVNSYFTKISIGYVGKEDLYDSALEIITNSRKVSVEAPGRVIFLLRSIMISIQNYQLSLATDLIIIQKKLIQILNVQVSTLQISFEKFNKEGDVISVEKGLTCNDKDEAYYTEIIDIYNNAIDTLKTMCTGVSRAINGTTQETSNPVNTTEFINIISSIVMDLSVDITNIDQEKVDDFNSMSFNSEFSDRQLETLMSVQVTLTSYASQLAAEVAMSQSNIQDIKMDQLSPGSSDNDVASGEPPMMTMGTPFMVDWGMQTGGSTGPGTLTNGMGMGTGVTMDMDSLNMKVDMLTSGITKMIRISELIANTTSECNLESSRAPDAYFDFVFKKFYLVIVTMDMDMENMAMDNMEASIDALGDENEGFLATFTEFKDDGIKCLHGSNEFDIIIVRVVLNVYIEMCQLSLALVQEEILEMTGECPAGFAIGDWSDDSGECCCDPSNQEDPPPTGETPTDVPGMCEQPVEVEGSGERPVEIDGEVPVPVDGSGEEPVPVGGSGEEPVPLDGSGQEPVAVDGSGQKPVSIDGGEVTVDMSGSGEVPVDMGGSGEDPVLMGSGEEAMSMGSGEEAMNMGMSGMMSSHGSTSGMMSSHGSTSGMMSSHGSTSGMMSSHGSTSGMMSGHGSMSGMMSGHGDNGSMMSGHARWKRQDHNMGSTHGMPSASGQSSVQSSESPYLIGSGYGSGSGSGEKAVQIDGSGEEAVFMGSGEDPVTIYGEQPFPIDGSGENPVSIDGSGEQPVPIDGSGEQPIPVDGSGEQPIPVDGEQPIPVDGSGEQPIPVDGEQPIPVDGEQPIPVDETVSPPPPTEGKCYPKKKFCRCREVPMIPNCTAEPPTTDGEEPIPIDEGEEPVPIDGSGEEPVLIGGSGEEPVLMEGFGSGEVPVSAPPVTGGLIPHKLTRTTPGGGSGQQTSGMIPVKLTTQGTGFTPVAKQTTPSL